MSRKKGLQLAAGMVLLREKNGEPQVAVVHRPLYDDWTLPKGKPDTDELLPVTAFREVREETGYEAILGAPLGQTEHLVGGKPKRTSWWRGVLRSPKQHKLDAEVDQVEWLSVDAARKRLTYSDDAQIMLEAVKLPPTLPFLVVRHAKAMVRKNWTGDDADRRLDERGRRQAKRVADLLEAYGVGLLASSSSTRCMTTFVPYAKRMGLPIEAFLTLSEEGADDDPEKVDPTMNALRIKALETGRRLAVCGHRPVLPRMVENLGVRYQPMKPAEAVIAHLDDRGRALRIERIPPRF